MSDLGNVKKMFGQELNISVTNADANVIASTPRLVPNTIIISSPQNANEKKDIIENNIHQTSIFATDYNGIPVQITHVVKVGNGLYMDESRAIALGIDNHTLVTDSSSNRLCVQTTGLEKASSVSLGVVKTASTCQRSENSFPKLGNMTGISINSDGELFITDQLLQLIYNYINDSINTAIAPLLKVTSDIHLIDNYKIIYYPSTVSNLSKQLIGLSLNEENNEIGVFNKIEFVSTQDNPLIVNFNINTDSGYPTKIETLEVISNVYDSKTISNVLMYYHQAENIFFEFYPNLTTQNIDYQLVCNVKDNEGTMIIEDTIFKFNQQYISNSKNELFNVTSIIIDDDPDNTGKSKIISIQTNINTFIKNYITNDVIPSLILNLSYKTNNNTINIPLDINKDNINNILEGNSEKINNLSNLSNNTEILWSVIANLNMNIGTNTNDTYEINSGLINVYKNTYNITYLLYYELDSNQILLSDETTQGTINYIQNTAIIDDTDSTRHYILRLQFLNDNEYNLFKSDSNLLKFTIYMTSNGGENYYVLTPDYADGETPFVDLSGDNNIYNYFNIASGNLSNESSIVDNTTIFEWNDNDRRLNIHIYNILLHKFEFEIYKVEGSPILHMSFTSNINEALYQNIETSLRYTNMSIHYTTYKTVTVEDSQLQLIEINEKLFNNLLLGNRSNLINKYSPFIQEAEENEYNFVIQHNNSANIIINEPSQLHYYYYFYDNSTEEDLWYIIPLYDNQSTNGINLYSVSECKLDEHFIIFTQTANIVEIPNSNEQIPDPNEQFTNVTYLYKEKLHIPELINYVFGISLQNSINTNIDLYSLLYAYYPNIVTEIKTYLSVYTKANDSDNIYIYFNTGSITRLLNNFIFASDKITQDNKLKTVQINKNDTTFISN